MKLKNIGKGAVAVAAAAAAVPLFVKPERRLACSDHGRNWQSVIRDDVKLNELFIPGAHDSASEKIFLAALARCQELTVAQQLEVGCRFLDLRLALTDDGFVAVHHATPGYSVTGGMLKPYKFDDIAKTVRDFLKSNPTETVILAIKNDGSTSDEVFADALYGRYFEFAKKNLYLENRVPTLGEVRGKAVMMRRFEATGVFADDKTGGLNAAPSLWGSMAGLMGHKKFEMARADGEKGETVVLQDCFTLTTDKKWDNAVLPLLERGRHEGELVMNYMSSTGLLFPALTASPLNDRFLRYEGLEKTGGGIFVFDFVDPALAQKVYSANSAYIDPEKSYPVNNEPYSENKTTAVSDYLNGYSVLIRRLSRKGSD